MVLRRTNAAGSLNGARPPSAATIRRTIEADDGEHTAVVDSRGATLAAAVLTTEDPDLIVREVSSLWAQAQRTFLAIGRYLLQARSGIERRLAAEAAGISEGERRMLAQRDYRQLVLDRLPFGPKVAHQLESVARAVFEAKRIGIEDLPWSYSVAYQLTTLSADEFEAARSEGLVGPDARRGALIEFKRRKRAVATERMAELQARKARLLATIERLQQELRTVVSELGEGDASRTPSGTPGHDTPPSEASEVAV